MPEPPQPGYPRPTDRHDDPTKTRPRIVLRPIGSPLPLGFLALGAASITLSGSQLGWVPVTDGRQVALIFLVFVAPLQALSSVFGFLARDSVGGTGMGLLAGAWLATGIILLSSSAGSTSRALGLLLLFVALAARGEAGLAATAAQIDFARTVEDTFLGQVWGTKGALDRMRPRNRGNIVNVGSALAFLGIPLQSAPVANQSGRHRPAPRRRRRPERPPVSVPELGRHDRARTGRRISPLRPAAQARWGQTYRGATAARDTA